MKKRLKLTARHFALLHMASQGEGRLVDQGHFGTLTMWIQELVTAGLLEEWEPGSYAITKSGQRKLGRMPQEERQ
jgi:hypothetical protein